MSRINKLNTYCKNKHITDSIMDEVIYNYVNCHKGLIASGQKFGLSQRDVENILTLRGVQKRTLLEAKQSLRKYTVNDNFFKYQNADMAYLLGFLAADGSISSKENRIMIQLQKEDKALLEKINQLVESNREIKEYLTNAGNETCKIEFCSSEWKKDLAIYNIIPNKTFTLLPPTYLDKKYYIDYIRGYFDADGTIYYNSNNYKYGFEIVGASKAMIEWIRGVFANDYGITNNGLSSSKTTSGCLMYKFGIYNKSKIKQIRNLLYYDDNLLCLIRKKKKFFLFE